MSWTQVSVQIAAITRFVLKSNALNSSQCADRCYYQISAKVWCIELKSTCRSLLLPDSSWSLMPWTQVSVRIAAITRFVLKSNCPELKSRCRSLLLPDSCGGLMPWTQVNVQIAAITRFVLKSNALNLKSTCSSLVTSLVLKYDVLNSSCKYVDRCNTSLALEY